MLLLVFYFAEINSVVILDQLQARTLQKISYGYAETVEHLVGCKKVLQLFVGQLPQSKSPLLLLLRTNSNDLEEQMLICLTFCKLFCLCWFACRLFRVLQIFD